MNNDKIMWEINIVPLTDVFMVLLVIFIIAAPILVLKGGIDVKLPATTEQKELNLDTVIITLTKDKHFYINEEKIIDGKLFMQKLNEAINRAKDKTVIIKGDREVLFGDAVSVMDLSKMAGAERIAILTEIGTPTILIK